MLNGLILITITLACLEVKNLYLILIDENTHVLLIYTKTIQIIQLSYFIPFTLELSQLKITENHNLH